MKTSSHRHAATRRLPGLGVLALGAWSALLTNAGLAVAQDGAGLPTVIVGREAPDASGVVTADAERMSWWAIPRRARAALRNAAAGQGAVITRCVRVETGDHVTYEVHARPRWRPFAGEEFVLTRFSETTADAETRRHANSLVGRVERLGEWLGGRGGSP